VNLLITRHDKIGDFITTLPMLQALKTQTTHRIIVLVAPVNAPLAQALDFIDDVIVYDDCILNLSKKIKEKKIHSSISCYIDNKIALALLLGRVKERIAPATKFAQIFFNRKITQRRSEGKKTEWEYNFDLAKALVPNLVCRPVRPFLNLTAAKPEKKRIAFHPGYGGSSDGNLKLEDYLSLAKSIANDDLEIVFTFGPDDTQSKNYIEKNLDFKATIYESKGTIVEFCEFLNSCEVLVSTSTGPMHLAGMLNLTTVSFFGDSLFASAKRWATISDTNKQHNFMLGANYAISEYQSIENTLKEIIDARI
jgi:ADP-heptose:LPS heptosyltransferase